MKILILILIIVMLIYYIVHLQIFTQDGILGINRVMDQCAQYAGAEDIVQKFGGNARECANAGQEEGGKARRWG